MIKKTLRFTQKEIDLFIKTPHKKIGNDLFVCRFKAGERLKIGVILSKKTYKTSVERNKVKRLLYDETLKLVKISGFYIISPQKSLKETKKEDVVLNIKDLLSKIN
jgi:ribonuclease P protein component